MGSATVHDRFAIGDGPAEDPAVRAWRDLCGPAHRVTEVETLKPPHRKGDAVYRLLHAGPDRRHVCAKRAPGVSLELELLVYREILPVLGLPSLGCFGLVEDLQPGRSWLFLEDAGDVGFDESDPVHVAAVSVWLGSLHGAGERLSEVSLEPRGSDHYLELLRRARAQIAGNRDNPAYAGSQSAMLEQVAALLASLEDRWAEVERGCEGVPDTIVHDDLQPKNIRIVCSQTDPIVHVLDWETIGRGNPAADLTRRLDLARYREARVRAGGSDLDEARLRRLGRIGRVFGTLKAIEWASRSLPYSWRTKPVEQLRVYRDMLGEQLDFLGPAVGRWAKREREQCDAYAPH